MSRSTTADSTVTMGMAEFLRGGYKSVAQPTIVNWHGKPMFVVTPIDYAPVPGDAQHGGSPPAGTTGYITGWTPPSARTVTTQSFAPTTTLPSWLRGDTSGKGQSK